MSKARRIPPVLIALDVLGALFLALAVLGAVDVDIGLPLLSAVWPFLLVLGLALMAPLIVWVVRTARQAT